MCIRLQFPGKNESVEDIAREMRSVPQKDELLYELRKCEKVVDEPMVLVLRREMTLATLADRLDAAIKRREDEASRLWKAVDELKEWFGRMPMFGKGNADSLFECVLGQYGLKKKEGAK